MNILIIATYFPPDSTIAAVRPYMFAKHLSAMGENVTVIRTGYFDQKPFDEYEKDQSFEVLSALGRNCPAEKFERGEYEGPKARLPGRLEFLPRIAKLPLRAVNDSFYILRGQPPTKLRRSCNSLKYQKRLIDRLYGRNRKYDIVFSTCGEFENIYAGKYAAGKFGAKWIMDFRDSMTFKNKGVDDIWYNIYGRESTLYGLRNADTVTAISSGLKDELYSIYPAAKMQVLYNGFDDNELIPDILPDKDRFSLCYTGRLYEGSMPALNDLAYTIARLIDKGLIDRGRIRISYAGSSSEEFSQVFSKAGISDILSDRGYISKNETLELQLSSDLFTVLAWNTRGSKGIISGKFYEGIKARKPILALVSGSIPESELMQLQRKYDYGFCYEQAEKKVMLSALEDYILKLYSEKISSGSIDYQPSRELYGAFGYSSLSRRLHDIMLELTEDPV